MSASRVAFYASTPSYLVAFESEGYGEVARNLQQLSRAQRWDEMAALVDDGMLDTYAVTGTYDEIAAKLRARYAGVATAIDFAIPLADAGRRKPVARDDRRIARGLTQPPRRHGAAEEIPTIRVGKPRRPIAGSFSPGAAASIPIESPSTFSSTPSVAATRMPATPYSDS